MSEIPVLYTFRRCPYAMRARLALAVSGLPCEQREITLRQKPPEMLAASPKGTVPVLVLPDGAVIDESLAIMQWALAQQDPEGWLRGDAQTLQASLALIAHNDGPFKRDLDRYKYPNRFLDGPSVATGDAVTAFAHGHRAAGTQWLHQLEGALQSTAKAQWLLGPQCALVDMALLPFVRQFAHVDPVWFATQPWPALATWLTRFEASQRFAEIMQKRAVWSAAPSNCYRLSSF